MNAQEVREKAKQWLELAEKATPGPWEVAEKIGTYSVRQQGKFQIFDDIVYGTKEDAQFIAAARNDAPALAKWVLDAVDVLESIANYRLDPDEDWMWGYVRVKELAQHFLEGSGDDVTWPEVLR